MGAIVNVALKFGRTQVGFDFFCACLAAIDRHPQAIAEFTEIGIVARVIAIAPWIKRAQFPAGFHQDHSDQRDIKRLEPGFDIAAFVMFGRLCLKMQTGRREGDAGAACGNGAAFARAVIKYGQKIVDRGIKPCAVVARGDNDRQDDIGAICADRGPAA